jgi:hypothetical protein
MKAIVAASVCCIVFPWLTAPGAAAGGLRRRLYLCALSHEAEPNQR